MSVTSAWNHKIYAFFASYHKLSQFFCTTVIGYLNYLQLLEFG